MAALSLASMPFVGKVVRHASLYISKLQQKATPNDIPARQTAQTFYATVAKPTVTALFQAVEAARLVHAAADAWPKQ
jgi:hypothetical protein